MSIEFKAAFFAPLFCAFLCALICGCGDGRQAQKSPEPDTVYVARPLESSVEIWDDFTARINAVKTVEVRARVNGYLEKINFAEGEYVKEGDLLFVIDQRPYKARVSAARANVEEIEARLALAGKNLERAKGMYKSKVISKEILDTRDSDLLAQKAALSNAKAQLADAELNLEFTSIRAPISGRIGETRVDEGNLITADSTVLTTIEKDDVVQAYFEISERDLILYNELGLLGKIDPKGLSGPEVEVRLSSGSRAVFGGKVTFFDNRMGNSTSSLTLRADIKNDGGVLKPGMFAKLRLKIDDARGVLLVREDVIGTDLVGRYVYVVDGGGKIVYKPVKVGRLTGPYRIVESGISKGDRVVVKGLHNAAPGRAVKAVEIKMDSE